MALAQAIGWGHIGGGHQIVGGRKCTTLPMIEPVEAARPR